MENWFYLMLKIGIMYLVVSFVALLRAISDAVMIRAQISYFCNRSFFESHFAGVIPASIYGTWYYYDFLCGDGYYIWRDKYYYASADWCSRCSLLMNSVSFGCSLQVWHLNISLGLSEFSAAGWLAYPPLSGIEYSPGTETIDMELAAFWVLVVCCPVSISW